MQGKVKSKQAKSSQAKGKPEDFFFSFSFFQALKGLVSKVSISNKKNRQFQLLNTAREQQPLFLEGETNTKKTPPTTHNFWPHFFAGSIQNHSFELVSQEESSKGEKTRGYEVHATRKGRALLIGG